MEPRRKPSKAAARQIRAFKEVCHGSNDYRFVWKGEIKMEDATKFVLKNIAEYIGEIPVTITVDTFNTYVHVVYPHEFICYVKTSVPCWYCEYNRNGVCIKTKNPKNQQDGCGEGMFMDLKETESLEL